MSRRVLKEERNYILQMIKKIRASGANVLLIQKSILRDAVTDLSLHYLVILGLLFRLGNQNPPIQLRIRPISMQSTLAAGSSIQSGGKPKALLYFCYI